MEQPATPGQDPQATPDPTQAASQPPAPTPSSAPPTESVGSGPWANDLASQFADPQIRASVDEFLRAKVQPYTTKLEQETAQAKQAMNLWTSLESDPINTYVQMTHELYGEAAAQQVLDALQTTLQQQDPAQPPQEAPVSTTPPNDPRIESLINWAEEQQTQQHYNTEYSRIAQENPDLQDKIERGLLHSFVAGAGGDFDQAVQMFRDFEQMYGTPAEPPPAPAAPPVFGSDTDVAAPSATPVEPRSQTLDEAINDFMSEQRSARQAPPMGAA